MTENVFLIYSIGVIIGRGDHRSHCFDHLTIVGQHFYNHGGRFLTVPIFIRISLCKFFTIVQNFMNIVLSWSCIVFLSVETVWGTQFQQFPPVSLSLQFMGHFI